MELPDFLHHHRTHHTHPRSPPPPPVNKLYRCSYSHRRKGCLPPPLPLSIRLIDGATPVQRPRVIERACRCRDRLLVECVCFCAVPPRQARWQALARFAVGGSRRRLGRLLRCCVHRFVRLRACPARYGRALSTARCPRAAQRHTGSALTSIYRSILSWPAHLLTELYHLPRAVSR